MNKLLICALLAIGITSSALAGKDYFASPGEPHGLVTGIVNLPARELFAVNISEVNGKRTARQQGVWLKPGTYTINAKGAVVDLRRSTALGREARRDRGGLGIELEVEAGKIYYIALDTSSPNRRDWHLVNWRVEER